VAALAAAAAGDPDPLVRATAAWRLRPFAERREAFAALAGALGDSSAFVRFTAAKALGLAPAPAAPAAAREAGRALGDADPAVRAAAARLGRGSPASAPQLLALLADADERVRRAATESLGVLTAARPGLVERLEGLAGDSDPDVRELADRALVASGGKRQSARMLRALAEGDQAGRLAALASLERIYRVDLGRPGFGGVPVEKLGADWARWVRDCWHLSEAGALERAARAPGSRLKGEALLALVLLTGPERAGPAARELAGELAVSEDPGVRNPAAAALCLMGEPRGRGVILADLASSEWPARHAACRAAAHLRPADAAAALAGLLGDESAAIRCEAHRSLCALAGRDLGFDPDAPAAARAAQQRKWAEWAGSVAGPGRPNGAGTPRPRTDTDKERQR